MKKINVKTKLIIFIALIALASAGIVRNVWHTQAQTTQSPPIGERISFGMVGITQGQTARLGVANIIQPNDFNYPPGPTRVVLTFRDSEGRIFRNRDGNPLRRVVMLERGQSTFLDLNFDDYPPGPTRLQLRAVVTVQPPPFPESNALAINPCAPTVEVINSATGRTSFVLAALPAVQRTLSPPIGD